MKKEEREEK